MFGHADHLNSPRAVYNDQQQLVWRHDQAEPFGNNPADENPAALGAFEFPLRDEGTYADKETNLVYNLNRYRDLDSGRFVQADPLGLDSGDLSLYVLRRNNPLSFVDPEGLQAAGGVSPQQQRNYQKCLDEELKYCTIGTGGLCGILCAAAATRGGVPAAIVVAGLCFPTVNHLCVRNKERYCADKWTK